MIRIKEFYPTFGLRFNWYSDDEERDGNLINICLIWGNLWLQIPRILKARVKRVKAESWDAATIARMGRDWYEDKTERVYGLTFTGTDLHVHYGIQPGCWSSHDKKNSDHTKLFTYPWADWQHMRHEVMLVDGTWVKAPDWRDGVKEPEPTSLYREQFAYHYKDQYVDQTTTATVTVERREWRLKLLRWLPLFAKKSQCIAVDFADEMGSRRGSWKGGTIGCGYEMLPTETPEQTLRRMESERKFR